MRQESILITVMANVSIRVKNFRALRDLAWSPSELCLLCGANGTGKSTALDALLFLRTLFERGHEVALQLAGGQYFKHLDASDDDAVGFDVCVGDIAWRLRFPMGNHGVKGHFGEELVRGDTVVLRAGMFDEGWYLGAERQAFDETRCCAKVLWDRGESAWMRPLSDALSGFRVYPPFDLTHVRRPDQDELRDAFLARTGRNLWSVLANWKAAPARYRGQFDRVMAEARRAFPGLIDTVEFDRGLPVIYAAGALDPDRGLPPGRMADGLLSGLLCLTALVGARPGSVVAFDEIESRLHPHAIRMLISAMRREVETRNITVILTTHSPVVMNEFRDEPDHVFVLEPSADHPTVPYTMTALHSEEWLAQAKLGTLYDRLAFAAPPVKVR